MTDFEILKIKEHIEIHARREPASARITQIMRKAVTELERTAELEKENAELKGERTFILELTEAELKELDSATYEMASYENCMATVQARDMDKNIHSLRAKVIALVNQVHHRH